MKRLYLILFAICVVLVIVYGKTLNVTAYLHQFDNIPNFTDLIDDLNNCWTGVGYDWSTVEQGFSSVTDIVSFFEAFGNVFVALFSVFKGIFVTLVYVPTKLLIYLIITLFNIIPHPSSFKDVVHIFD